MEEGKEVWLRTNTAKLRCRVAAAHGPGIFNHLRPTIDRGSCYHRHFVLDHFRFSFSRFEGKSGTKRQPIGPVVPHTPLGNFHYNHNRVNGVYGHTARSATEPGAPTSNRRTSLKQTLARYQNPFFRSKTPTYTIRTEPRGSVSKQRTDSSGR